MHALAALLTAAALAAAPPRAGLVVPGRSLGGLRLGATPAQVERAWGSAHGVCRGCADPTWYFTYRPFRPQGVGVAFRDGRAGALFTLWSPRGWRTPQGLRVGDDAARVTELYGPLPRVECGSYYALELIRPGALSLFYVAGRRVWGFGLSRPSLPPCR